MIALELLHKEQEDGRYKQGRGAIKACLSALLSRLRDEGREAIEPHWIMALSSKVRSTPLFPSLVCLL